MKNLRVSKKLLISYAVVLILLVAATIVSIVNFVSIGNQVETFYNGPYMAKGAAANINASFEQMQKSVYRAISNTDAGITQEAVNNAENASAKIQNEMPTVKKNFMGDQHIVARLEAALSELAPMREQVLAMASENRTAEAAAYMEQNNIPTIKKAQTELDALMKSADQKGDELLISLSTAQTKAIVTLIVLGGFSILMSILFAAYITKSIAGPLQEIEKAAQDMAGGSLNPAITYHSRDELGTLSDSMRVLTAGLQKIVADISQCLRELADGNFLVDSESPEAYLGEYQPILRSMTELRNKLCGTLQRINQSADQVASGSDQVSSGAQALSQGATEQASSVEELAASISEISEQVKRNAESAQSSSRIAEDTGSQVQQSNEKMQEMISAMDDISNTSGEIGKIIKTIEDIAFQTNILALNAAVEAARAGAAGKGFAVVADEVRNLASKSAEASKNTSALIESSVQAVQRGTRIADETAHALLSAVDGVKKVVQNIDEISRASGEQATSINQVTLGVEQISAVVQTNSATAEESAAASEELSGQAQMLKNLVGQFKLMDDDTAAVYSAALPSGAEAGFTPALSAGKY